MRFALVAAALAALVARSAAAQDGAALLCCGTKTCPEGTVANEAMTACCDPSGSSCEPTPNLGKRCDDDPAAAATGVPARRNVAGCVEVPGVACVGGQIGDDSGPVAGCVCVGDACEADVDFPNGKPACTRIAVDACCEAGACR